MAQSIIDKGATNYDAYLRSGALERPMLFENGAGCPDFTTR